jgi:UDP-glucose 4-epimerase
VKVLVTGGSGFIGSHVVDRLLEAGHAVRNYDLRPSPYQNGAIEHVRGDIVDTASLERAVAGCDAVIHLAAVSDVNMVLAEPALAEVVNAGGTRVVLETARLAGIGRVVYASTVWVYGDANGHGVVDEDEPLTLPGHVYTATKLAGEMYCASYASLYGLETTIVRLGIPYGPRARPATVLATFVSRALAGEPIVIAGDGLQSRRFVYVEDLAGGVVAALASNVGGRVYNLVGSESTTVRQVAQTVTRVVRDVPVVHAEGRSGDVTGVEVSGERALRELGWEATTAFEEGVERYVDWVTGATHEGGGQPAEGGYPLSRTNGSPVAAASSTTRGNAAAVPLHEPGVL